MESNFCADVIVLLCYQSEIVQQTGGQDLVKKYGRDGFAVIWFPIDDLSVPLVSILLYAEGSAD